MRLDNAVVIDFLTSTASALSERGMLEAKDADNLRLALSGIGAAGDLRELPVLVALDRQRAEFLHVLEARFGRIGFSLNLLRYSMRTPLAETVRLLGEFGTGVLKKAELLFNRPFLIARDGIWERHAPYSAVLIDFSEALQGIGERVAAALQELRTMNGHAMAGERGGDLDADLAVADALGFSSVTRSTRLGRTEIAVKRAVALALEDLAAEVSLLAEQLAANAGNQESYDVAVGCDALRAECVRLSHLELPLAGGIIAWEIRRRAILEALGGVNEALTIVTSNALALIGQDSKLSTLRLPESAKRRVAFDLIASGTPAGRAWEASDALFTYIARQQILPSQVLVGELGRIHTALLPRSLETAVAIERDQSLMGQATHEKTHALGRARKLTEAFARLALALTFLVAGCGLKTRPVSDVPELRPDIPFRAQQQAPHPQPPQPQKDPSHGQ